MSSEFPRVSGLQGALAFRRLIVLALCLAAPGIAQTVVLELTGPSGANVGGAFALAGNHDDDPAPDYLIADPVRHSGGEVVLLCSSVDGSVLHTFETPQIFIHYGSGLAGGSDVDGDAIPDIIIGAHFGSVGAPSSDTGTVFVYSGATFGLIREHVGDPGENLGYPIAFVGDLDGDGTAEYAAGATHDGLGFGVDEVGEAYVYSGATGAELHHLSDGAPGDFFGFSLASIGDVDADGVSDLCIGAPIASSLGSTFNGAVYVYSGASGQLIRKDEQLGNLRSYGLALASTGDVDLDGTPDYVTTAWVAVNGADVVSGATGGFIKHLESPLASGLFYGPSNFIDTIADVDGDGIREVLLRYYGDTLRHAYVAGADDNAALYYMFDETGLQSTFPGALSNAGDRDGDGRDEILTSTGTNTAQVHSTRPIIATPSAIPHATGGAVELDLSAGVPHAGAKYFVLSGLTVAGPSTGCSGLPVGSITIPLCYDLLFHFSIILAGVPPFIDSVGTLDSLSGRGQATFDLAGVPLPASSIGVTLWFAFIAKPGPAGGPWSFVSNPEPVVVE